MPSCLRAVTRELGETWWIRARISKVEWGEEGGRGRPAGGARPPSFHPAWVCVERAAGLLSSWEIGSPMGRRRLGLFLVSRALSSPARAEGPQKPQVLSCERRR